MIVSTMKSLLDPEAADPGRHRAVVHGLRGVGCKDFGNQGIVAWNLYESMLFAHCYLFMFVP